MKEYYLSFVRVWHDAGMDYSAIEQVKIEVVQYIGQGIDGSIVYLKDGKELNVKPKSMIRVHQ